jgi:phage major head subunit gpT-like protein
MLTQSRIDAATNSFRAVFVKAYDGATPSWAPIALEVESTSATETYEFITGVPGMKELIGEVKLDDFANAGFSIANKEWESTVQVKIADVERDKLGLYSGSFQEMAEVARFHPQELLAGLLSNGFSSVDYTGSAFFADSKPYDPKDKSKNAPTFDNKLTAALSAASFVAARTKLKEMKNAKGKNLNLGRRLVLVVPPALEETANKLRTAEMLPSAAGTASETNTLRNTFEVLVLNDLTSSTAWFLLEGGRAIKPLVVQFEARPQFIAGDDPKSTHAINTKKFLYQAYGRWNAGYALPQFAVGSTGAG